MYLRISLRNRVRIDNLRIESNNLSCMGYSVEMSHSGKNNGPGKPKMTIAPLNLCFRNGVSPSKELEAIWQALCQGRRAHYCIHPWESLIGWSEEEGYNLNSLLVCHGR